MLMKTPNQSLTEQLSARLAQRIRDRLLPAGARLPSVRDCARAQGVNPSTVVAAYDQLQAWGLVEARPRKGYFVRHSESKMPSPLLQSDVSAINADGIAMPLATDVGGRVPSPVNATALIRGMFHRISDKPQPGMGVFPPDWLATPFMTSAVRKVLSPRVLEAASLSYGEPKGDPGLRQALALRLRDMSIDVPASQIITTVGATHALDVISRTLLKPGDAVMVEEPGWAVEFARLDTQGVRILPVPRGPLGPDLDVMARYCLASPTGTAPKDRKSVV